MKKIISILIVALVALAFMGCPTTYPNRELDTPSCWMVGAINYDGAEGGVGNVFTKLTVVDFTHQSYEFTYAASMSGYWGSPSNGVAFVITKGDNNWDKTFKDATLVLGGDYVESGSADSNATVVGLEVGKTYIFTLDVSSDTYKGKIALKE